MVLEVGEDGYYVARCVEVPEAVSQGRSREEALENVKEAIEAVLEWRMKREGRRRGKAVERVEVSV